MSLDKGGVVGKTFKSNQGSYCVVVEYVDCYNVRVKFLDENSHECFIPLSDLRRGEFKNPYFPSVFGVGYVGVGHFKPYVDGKVTQEYSCWLSMMERNYCKDREAKYPSYTDCYVSKNWHNFQNFAEWYTSQKFYGAEYHLDKDVLVSGNKVYSEETCSLVPVEINNLLISPKKNKGKYPTGVCLKKSTGKFVVQIKKFGKAVHVGYFNTIDEAKIAYKKEKEKYVKEVAVIWKDKVDQRVFNSLINWKFEDKNV